jgi:hypothetical protein
MPLQLPPHRRMSRVLQPILLGRAQPQHLCAARDQLRQLALRRARRWRDRRPQRVPELGQDGGIEPIGFRQTALGARKVAHLPRIDDRHRDPARAQRRHRGAFITARGFTNDMHGSEAADPAYQRALTGRRVGELPCLRPRRCGRVQIEGGFGNIHSDIDAGLRHS